MQGLILGLGYVLADFFPGVQNMILYKQAALVGVSLWGWLAALSSLLLLVSMWRKHKVGVSIGSFVMFTCWIFAVIVYLLGHYWLLTAMGVTDILIYGYLYLASQFGMLWDYSKPLDD